MFSKLARSAGAVLLLVIALQAISGFVLALHYSPSVGTAWASIVFLEERIHAGRFLRGLHSWGASAIVLLAVLHVAVTAARGAYRKPRELAWGLGVALFLLVLAFAHTGYPLPWDQKGYWSTKVATNIAGATPVIGVTLQRLAVGGEEPGNLTLTRFYAVHVILLPLLLLTLVRWHIRAFAKHRTEPYFPEHAFRDLLAFLAVASVLSLLAWRLGPSLEAPADPTSDFQPRPEWYFLPLYQLLKFFPGRLEFLGSEVIPTLILAAWIGLPWIDRRSRKAALLVVFVPLLLAAVLGAVAALDDATRPDLQSHRREEARDARLARRLFRENGGVPSEGPLALLDRYPPRLGARVYKERCANCHSGPKLKGPDLTGYLSQRWLEDVIRDPEAKFGALDTMGKTDAKPDELAALAVYVISLAGDERARAQNPSLVERGRQLFDDKQCATCHETKGHVSDEAPNLAAYGSEEWLVSFVKKPSKLYVAHDKMPAFEGKLTDAELHAVAIHLRTLKDPEGDD